MYANPPAHICRLFLQCLHQFEIESHTLKYGIENADKYPKSPVFKSIIFSILDSNSVFQSHNPRGNVLPFKETVEKYHKRKQKQKQLNTGSLA